jgi:hypothetical protein
MIKRIACEHRSDAKIGMTQNDINTSTFMRIVVVVKR